MLTVVVTISLTMVDSSLKFFQNPNHKFLPPTIFKELRSFKLFGHPFWQITTNYSFSPSFIFHQSHPFSIIFFLFRMSFKPRKSHDEFERVCSDSPMSKQAKLNPMAKACEGNSSSQRVEKENEEEEMQTNDHQ